jgi:hypothetical protein
MEDGAKERVNDLRRVLERNPEECRTLLKLVLDGPVTFKPIELPEGPRYEVHARASLKKILAAATGTPRFTNVVSPAGELSNFVGCKPALFLCHVDELGPTRARRAGEGRGGIARDRPGARAALR